MLLRKLITYGIALWLSLSPVKANEIILDNPTKSMEANSSIMYSLRKEANKIIKTNNKITTLVIYLIEDLAIEKLSHEYSHIREGNRYGDYNLNFNLLSFTDSKSWRTMNYTAIPVQEARIACAGLNQDEHNAYYIWKSTTNKIKVDDAMAYLVSKLWDSVYSSRNDITVGGDLDGYADFTSSSKGRITTEKILSDVLNSTTWDSLHCVTNYLKTGKTNVRMSQLPHITHYLTENGSFFDIRQRTKDNSEEYALGFGSSNGVRLGYKKINNQSVSPFAYIGKGYSVGLEWRNKQYFISASYNSNDTIENKVKGKKNKNFNIQLGINVSW